MKKIFLMSLILMGCNNNSHTIVDAPAVEAKPTLTDEMKLTYGQKVRMSGGFYKGCTGKVVGFGGKTGTITYDIDLDKSCDISV